MIQFNRKFDPGTVILLIFDLDGTLIDSRQDLINSVNATLRHFGRHELLRNVITTCVGDGLSMLLRRAFGEQEYRQLLREAKEFLGAEVRRLALCLNDHQAEGACAQRLPALLTDLIEPCKADQTQGGSADVDNVILVT